MIYTPVLQQYGDKRKINQGSERKKVWFNEIHGCFEFKAFSSVYYPSIASSFRATFIKIPGDPCLQYNNVIIYANVLNRYDYSVTT